MYRVLDIGKSDANLPVQVHVQATKAISLTFIYNVLTIGDRYACKCTIQTCTVCLIEAKVMQIHTEGGLYEPYKYMYGVHTRNLPVQVHVQATEAISLTFTM